MTVRLAMDEALGYCETLGQDRYIATCIHLFSSASAFAGLRGDFAFSDLQGVTSSAEG